jgi:hypothetical protein
MKTLDPSTHSLGVDFPGPIARCVLRLLVPARRREEFVGDLIEEAETVVLPKRGRAAAQRWFWRQALTSASPLYARHYHKEVGMKRTRWIVAALLLILGPLMALDPNVWGASQVAIALVVMAIVIPAVVGLTSGNVWVLGGAAVVSAVLLLAARIVSGVELRWYAMAWIFFIVLFVNWGWEHRPAQSAD